MHFDMKLYYVPNTRANRPRWLLEELEVPYELVRLDVKSAENRRAPYTTLNPLGRVPTLVDGETVIFESTAICLYLADKFPDKKLAPAIGAPERGAYLQWMIHAIAEIESPMATIHRHTRSLPEEKRIPAIIELEKERFSTNLGAVKLALRDKQFLFGEWFTAADVMVAACLGWAKLNGVLAGEPELEDYVRRCVARPAAKRARTD
jgi:glutathione S-transferase